MFTAKAILAAFAVGAVSAAVGYFVNPLVGIVVAIPLGFIVGRATADY